MELKKMIEIMQHFDNGREVEFKRTNEDDTKWEKLLPVPVWNWERFDYRIKPEKQKIIIEKWLCQDRFGVFVIVEASNIANHKKVKLIESNEYEVEL